MKNIELTIGIPMYNAEKYIGELLQCFKKENVNISYEVLIVNDGSSDNSLIEAQKNQNQNIRIINQENGGVSSARNTIIKNAKGKWLTFVDADDLIDFKIMVQAFNYIKNKKYDYIISVRNKNDYNKLIKLNMKKQIIYLVENEIINSPWQKFYKIENIRKDRIQFDENISMGEDALFNFNYFIHNRNYLIIYFNFYNYRQVNENSLCIKFKANRFDELMKVNSISNNLTNEKYIKKALECIRIKNARKCLFEMNNNKTYYPKYSDRLKFSKKLKKYKKMQYLTLNSFKSTVLYYTWYCSPTFLLPFFVSIKALYKTKVKKQYM